MPKRFHLKRPERAREVTAALARSPAFPITNACGRCAGPAPCGPGQVLEAFQAGLRAGRWKRAKKIQLVSTRSRSAFSIQIAAAAGFRYKRPNP